MSGRERAAKLNADYYRSPIVPRPGWDTLDLPASAVTMGDIEPILREHMRTMGSRPKLIRISRGAWWELRAAEPDLVPLPWGERRIRLFGIPTEVVDDLDD